MARILVAEDDDDLRALVVRALRADGHEVDEARNGQEAVDLIADPLLLELGEPPDLIVTDVRMPGMTGMSLLAGIRAYGWRTLVIVMTAYEVEASRAEAYYLGADLVVGKPIDVDALCAEVRTLLASKGSGSYRVRGHDPPYAMK